MNSKMVITAIVAVMVAGLLVGGVAVPIIDGATKETTIIQNENPQWVRMAYYEQPEAYTVGYSIVGDTVTITNGTDTQTGALMDTILYADDKTAIMVADGDVVLIGDNNGDTGYAYIVGDFTVSMDNNELIIEDSNSTYTFTDARGWAYVPLSTEKYGVFSTGGLNRYDSALACAGAYAGVYCYNSYVSQDVGLVMDADYTDDYITSVKWALESNNAKSKTIIPAVKEVEEKEVIDIIPQATIKSAPPTPTYTAGDWGYELNGTDATIVSYSGATGGVLTIPATVGGYTVVALGLGSNSSTPVVNTESPFTDLIISDGITTVNNYAFNYSGFTGTLTIPDSVISIGVRAFANTQFTGTLTLPTNLTTLKSNAFENDAGFTGTLTIPDGITSIPDSCFDNCRFDNIQFHDGVASIGLLTFRNNYSITSLELPDSLVTLSGSAFRNCTSITGTVTIPESVTSIGSNVFNGCSSITDLIILSDAVPGTDAFAGTTNLKEVLDLSAVEYTTTSYGLTADSVQDHIDGDSYLCITEVSETTQKEGAVIDVFLVIPVVMIAGAVLMAVRFFIRR